MFFFFQSVYAHLSYCICEDMDDFLVWRGYNALSIDFNNAMTDPNAAPFCNASAHQTANLINI